MQCIFTCVLGRGDLTGSKSVGPLPRGTVAATCSVVGSGSEEHGQPVGHLARSSSDSKTRARVTCGATPLVPLERTPP